MSCSHRWFPDRGTLLGSIRHGGFIPFDDIDIAIHVDYVRSLDKVLSILNHIGTVKLDREFSFFSLVLSGFFYEGLSNIFDVILKDDSGAEINKKMLSRSQTDMEFSDVILESKRYHLFMPSKKSCDVNKQYLDQR